MNYASSATGNRVKLALSEVCALGLMRVAGIVEGKILVLSLFEPTWGLIGVQVGIIMFY